MPYEIGGRADKEGNRYEIKYFILKILEVIEEKIDFIVLEAIGKDEKGIDIWVGHKDGSYEGQQCKGRNGSKDSWDYGSANSKQIFINWKDQLNRDENIYVSLVSPLAFPDLEDLLKRANNSSGNPNDFYDFQIMKSSTKFQNFYKNFCQSLDLDINNSADIQKSIYYLRKIFFHQVPDSFLKDLILHKISYLFNGDEKIIFAHLISWIIDGDLLGKKINILFINKFIRDNNIKFKNLSLDERIAPRIQQLNNEYKNDFLSLDNNFIERDVYSTCYDLIDNSESIIIHGKAGMGKSGTTEALIKYCESKEVPYLAIKLDKRVPNINSKKWGEDLGLPDSVAHCLHGLYKNEKVVLILDQLDALRWTLAHSRNALLVCSEIIEQVSHLNKERDYNISVVMVCRTIDLENDNNIRNLFKENNSSNSNIEWNKIKIDELESSEVINVIGNSYASLSPKLQNLLKIPSNLFIWCQLDVKQTHDECTSTNHLIEKWWEQLLTLYSQLGHPQAELNDLKDKLISKFIEIEKTYVPKIIFSGSQNELTFLSSSGFINIVDNKISFAHQSILDYLLSSKMLLKYYEGESMNEILGQKELQTPAKRYQLQMLMQFLLETDSADFIRVGIQLLENESIRFFNKYVFFEILTDIDKLDKNIERFILEYVMKEEWKDHLLNNVIYSKIPYYKLLLKNGIVNKWLSEDENREYTINLIGSVGPVYDNEDIELIKQHIFSAEKYAKLFAVCFPHDLSKDMDEMFDLRLQFYKKYPELNFYYMDFKSELNKHEFRTIKYISFLIENKLKVNAHKLRKIESEIFIENNDFLIENGNDVYNELIKYVPGDNERLYDFSEWSAKHYKDSLERIIVNLLKKAISSIAKSDQIRMKDIITELCESSNEVINELIFSGLYNLGINHSDYVIDFIVNNFENRIFIGTVGDGDNLSLVKKNIEKFSSDCNESLFVSLENKISRYISKDAKRYLERRIKFNEEAQNERVYWSFWGELQLELLSVLPMNRLSKEGTELLRVLNRKFSDGNERYRYYLGHSGFVASPVTGKILSEKKWLEIIRNNELTSEKRWKEIKGGFIESSIQQFASSFSETVKNRPIEMINLVLNNKKSVNVKFIDALYSGLVGADLSIVPNNLLDKIFEELPCDLESNRAMYMCLIIERAQSEVWSDTTLNILMDIATNHSDPIPIVNTSNTTYEKNKEIRSYNHISNQAINCVRGCAAAAIEHLVRENNAYFNLFKPTIDKLIKDSSVSVKLAGIYALMDVINFNKDWALQRILYLYSQDFRLAGHSKSQKIFLLGYDCHRELILETITNCFYSDDEDLVRSGAYAVSELYIVHDEFKDIFASLESLNKEQFTAMLEMAVIYFSYQEYNEKCKEIILASIKINSWDLEHVYSRLFYNKAISLSRDYGFLIKLIKAKTSRKLIWSFTKYLEEERISLVQYNEVIISLSKSIINNFDSKETNLWGIESELSKLIVGLYDEACNAADEDLSHISRDSLELWDKMYELRIGSIRELSKEIMAR